MGRLLLGSLIAAVCAAGSAGAPHSTPPAPADPPASREPASAEVSPDHEAPTTPTAAASGECTDRRTLRRADGSVQDCYPYVCRAGACLTRCDAMTDCAGAHTPAEFPAQGWPLECMPSGQCTPMHPDKVN